MNPWEGIASPATGGGTQAEASPWASVASPVEQAPAASDPQGNLLTGDKIPSDPVQRSFTDKINRNLQLLGRYGIEGPAAIASLPWAANDLADKAVGYVTGLPPAKPPLRIPSPSEAVDYGLDKLGMPKPEGPIERIVGDVSRAVAGSRSFGTPTGVTTSAGTGAFTSGAARELGIGPTGQFLWGMGGSMIGGPALYQIGNSSYGAVQPLFDKGRQEIADSILSRYATDPKAAAQAMQSATEFVPGSQPIAGEASNDPGLLGLQKTLQQQPENHFGSRLSEQNAARTNLLNQVTGDETTIPRYEAMRTAATKPLYDAANPQPISPDAFQPVLQKIDEQVQALGANSDAGKTLLSLKKDIQGALPETKQVTSGLLDANGNPITTTVATAKPQSNMIQIYRETRDALNRDAMQPGAYGATVKGVISPINQMLGQELESQSPEFAQAQQMFARMSQPITEAQNMQGLAKRLVTTQHDFQGNNMLSHAASERVVNNGEINTQYNGVQPLSEALSPEQNQALQAINSDLVRSNMVNSPVVRPPGSNTFNNTASTGQLANSIGARIGEHVPFIKGPYQAAKPDIIGKVANRMLSTQEAAAALLANPQPQNLTMAQRLIANALMGAKGGAIANATDQPQ